MLDVLLSSCCSICVSVGGGVGSGKWLREEVAATDDLT